VPSGVGVRFPLLAHEMKGINHGIKDFDGRRNLG